jgi:hypothetical protein
MNKTSKKRTLYRSSIDGRFITRKQAERRPRTTQKEHVRPNPPDPKR